MQNTGSVYQRGDGKWCCALMVNGKRKVLYAKNGREARKKLADLQGQVAVNGALPTAGKRTLDDLLDHWLEAVGHTLKPKTVADYRKASKHIRQSIGAMHLAKLEPGHLQKLYNRLAGEGKNRQAQLVHAILHRALKLAVLWGWLHSNPADRVLKPTYHAQRKELWTAEEMQTFLDGTAETWLHPLWLMALSTGCRLSELTGLRWTDVEGNTLAIRRNVQRIGSKWVEGTPKTTAGQRTIALPKEALEALRRQRLAQAERRLRVGSAWQDSGLVFTGEAGQPLNPSVVQHAIKRECQRLGLPELTPHGLRHLHATLLLANGLPITAVSARLGHANASITMSVYAHAMKKQDEEAAAAIGKVLAR